MARRREVTIVDITGDSPEQQPKQEKLSPEELERRRRDPPASEHLRKLGFLHGGDVASNITASPYANADDVSYFLRATLRTKGATHDLANADYQQVAAYDVSALQRDESVLFIDSDTIGILLMPINRTFDHQMDILCGLTLAGRVHHRVSKSDFPINSRGATFPYRAIAFSVPPSDGVTSTAHFSLLVYFVHHNDSAKRVESSQPPDPLGLGGGGGGPATTRPAFDHLRSAAHASRFAVGGFDPSTAKRKLLDDRKPVLYYYDSLGAHNYSRALVMAQKFCVELKLFDAACESEQDYHVVVASSPYQVANSCASWGVAFAEKIAHGAMRNHFGPIQQHVLDAMTDRVCAYSIADTVADRERFLLAWYERIALSKDIAAVRTELYTLLGRVVSLPPFRLQALAEFLTDAFVWDQTSGKKLSQQRESWAERVIYRFLNPDFVRLALACDLYVADGVVLSTRASVVAQAWAKAVDDFSSRGVQDTTELPHLFMWLHLPETEQDFAATRPSLVGLRPVYSRSLNFVRQSAVFCQSSGITGWRYAGAAEAPSSDVSAQLTDLLQEFDGSGGASSQSYVFSAFNKLMLGDPYISLVVLARAYARMDGWIQPSSVCPARVNSGYLNSERTQDRDEVNPVTNEIINNPDTFNIEAVSVLQSWFGRVMEVVAINGTLAGPPEPKKPFPQRTAAVPNLAPKLDLDAPAAVRQYSQVPPRDGIQVLASTEGIMRRKWAFAYNNIATTDAVLMCREQIRKSSVLAHPEQALTLSPCCCSTAGGSRLVYEHWSDLRSFAVSDRASASAWLNRLRIMTDRFVDQDLRGLKRVSDDSSLVQFPVVVHGRWITEGEEPPFVLSIAEVLTVVCTDRAFSAWAEEHLVTSNDIAQVIEHQAGLLAGPDIHHLDPFLHCTLDKFALKREQMQRKLQQALVASARASDEDFSLNAEAPSGDAVSIKAVLLTMPYAHVALVVVAYLAV